MSRFAVTFVALIATQAAHSLEEYAGRLYESFPPARFVSGLVSSDLQRGFVIRQCLVGRLRPMVLPVAHPPSLAIRGGTGVGVGRDSSSLMASGTRFGRLSAVGTRQEFATAPVLFVLALLLVRELRALP